MAKIGYIGKKTVYKRDNALYCVFSLAFPFFFGIWCCSPWARHQRSPSALLLAYRGTTDAHGLRPNPHTTLLRRVLPVRYSDRLINTLVGGLESSHEDFPISFCTRWRHPPVSRSLTATMSSSQCTCSRCAPVSKSISISKYIYVMPRGSKIVQISWKQKN